VTADFQSAIRNAEGQLSLARDNLNLYEKLFRQWRDEVSMCSRVLDRLREAAGIPLDAPILKPVGSLSQPIEASPMPVFQSPAELKETIAAAPLTPAAVAAQAGANGLDRAGLRRQLRDWHVKYPMAKSYKSPGQLARQAFRALIIDHPDYNAKWLAMGHQDLTDANVSIPVDVLENAGKVVGIEWEPVRKAAYRLQREVEMHGVQGTDYLWEAW
jgi:hypothetical protein